MLGVDHFLNLFNESKHVNMGKILKLISFFPRLIDEEENHDLYKEVTKSELLAIMSSFKMDKSPRPGDWTT